MKMELGLTKKVVIFFYIISFVFLLFKTQAFANIYYVAKDGSDSNPGTEVQPWFTIQKAADTLVAGDIVYIKSGTYIHNTSITPKNSGKPDNYITYSAYPGNEVTVDGQMISLPNWYGVIKIVNKEYIKISGLKIINSEHTGIFVTNSSNIIIKGNQTYETYSSGIGIWGSKDITVDDNVIQRACWPTYGIQECLSVNKSQNVKVMNNHIHEGGNKGGEGIDIKNGSSNVIVYNNHIHGVYSVGIYIDASQYHSYEIDVINNTVHDINGNGIVVSSEQGGLLENVRIFNNIVYDNNYQGIVIGWALKPINPLKKIYVFHNTVYSNDKHGIYIGASVSEDGANKPKDIVVINNISSQNIVNQIGKYPTVPVEELTVENNLIYGPSSFTGDNPVRGDPMFVNPLNKNFHLQTNSPCINTGKFITTTNSAGSGTVIPVANTNHLTDTYGLIKGTIQLEGQTQTAKVTSVNYSTNTITVDTYLTWSNGQGVSYAYSGTKPDIGAYEHQSVSPPGGFKKR